MTADPCVAAAVPVARRAPTGLLVLLTAALIGSNYVALKEAAEHASPIALTSIRAGLGGVVLVAFVRFRRDPLPRDRRELAGIFVVSLLVSSASSTCLVLGVRLLPSGLAALLAATMPLFTALFAIGFLGERPARLAGVGLVLGVVGVAVLSSPALDGRTDGLGLVYLLIATATWAAGVVVQKAWPWRGVSPTALVATQLVLSAVTVGVVATVVEGWGDVDWGWSFLLPVGYSGIVAMAIPFALLTTVIRRAPATQAAATAYLIPVFGVVASWLLRGERLHPIEVAGGALVLVGVAAVNRAGVSSRPARRES